jgi:hypothetical protein
MARPREESHSHINLDTPGLPPQTLTPYAYTSLPDKAALVSHFRGKTLSQLRTPAMVIDRSTFATNCALMHGRAAHLGTLFRAHVKTHKVRLPCFDPSFRRLTENGRLQKASVCS